MTELTRRQFVGSAAALAATTLWSPSADGAQATYLTKPIPSSGEGIHVIGMGTWITFNVGSDPKTLRSRTAVMKAFSDLGGGMVDSSPMYGSAREIVGKTLERLDRPSNVFSADKIWTSDGGEGPEQFEESAQLWGTKNFDLMQIHNLRAWKEHLPFLRKMKEAGRAKYIGISTSHGRRHGELEAIMKSEPLDFVQLTYNAVDREVERRLLPVARERGIAVIANRPFRGGTLVDRAKATPLPEWAAEIDCENWAQILLKYIVSHPALTVAIPATSKVAHMRENMGASRGRMPDAAFRKRIEQAVAAL